jgi:hypothetical protein
MVGGCYCIYCIGRSYIAQGLYLQTVGMSNTPFGGAVGAKPLSTPNCEYLLCEINHFLETSQVMRRERFYLAGTTLRDAELGQVYRYG